MEEEYGKYGIVLMLFLIVIYVFVGSWMEHKHFKFGHETGAIIIIGVVFSFAIWGLARLKAKEMVKHPGHYEWLRNSTKNESMKLYDSEYMIINHLEFNTEMFFDVFLPLIIFATGFNMRR